MVRIVLMAFGLVALGGLFLWLNMGSGDLRKKAELKALDAMRAEMAELADLLARLRDLPDVREEVIEDVEEKIRNGSLMTREAAEATAREILEQLATQEAEA